jgi:PAS domain S-box-containing protein
LTEALGATEAEALLFRAGRQWGEAEARETPDPPGREAVWLARAIARLDELGFAQVTIDSFEFDRGNKECRVIARASDSVERDLQRSEKRPAQGPLCRISAGYLTGFAAIVTGLDVVCSTFRCAQHCLHDGCPFEIRPAHHGQELSVGGRAPSGSARFFLESLGQSLGGGDISLADLVENSADAVIFIDQGNIIRYWNRGAETMFQYDREETLGRRVGFLLPRDLLENDELGRIQARLTREGSLPNYVTRRVRKDGEERWVSLTRSVLHDSQGAVIGSTAVFRDITEQRQTEEELFRSRGLAMVGEIAANLAHEIKNRVTGIYAATQLLSRSLLPGDPRCEVYGDVGQEIKKLDETAKDLLRFARPVPPKRTPTDVQGFLVRVIQSLERSAQVHVHDVVLDVEPDLLANFDPDLMGQVFSNLVLNAAQAMEKPGRIEVRARRTNGDVEFHVTDTGPGIPPDVMASLFRPFFTTKSQGTGLGLSIARKNVELHGGTIQVETALGKGTRFVIRMPLEGGERPLSSALRPNASGGV